MRREFSVAIVALLLFSCQPSEQKPQGILPKEDMVRVLSDLYILEEKITRLSLPLDSAQQVFELLKANVFEENGVQDSVFKKSFNYYVDHPIEMEAIYTVLVDTLQLREQRAPYRPGQQ